jgi:predicted GTPase
LKNTTEDLNTKKQSVDFVNKILNAQLTKDEHIKANVESTLAVVNFVQNDICDIIKSEYSDGKEAAEAVSSGIERWADLQQKTWLKDKVIIAFIGEFSAGKTSIVNRIFTQDKPDAAFTLPTNRGATTAVATYISYGSSVKVRFTDPVGDLRELDKNVFEKFTKESLGNLSISRLVSHFVTEYNNENLKQLSILDTPGFSSGDKEDEERTTAVLNEVDMLFWVVDGNTGDINTTSLKIIKENVGDIPLYVVINKVDSKAPAECKQIEDKMRLTMEKAKIPVKGYIQFSNKPNKHPLKNLTSVISTVQPRKPNYDVIVHIKAILDERIKHYSDLISEEKEKIVGYQRAITEAESIIDAFQGKYNGKINKFNRLGERLHSDEVLGSTLFSSKNNKIKDVDLFWDLYDKQIAVTNDIEELYDELIDAYTSEVENANAKSDAEASESTFKESQKHLKDLKSRFMQLTQAVIIL